MGRCRLAPGLVAARRHGRARCLLPTQRLLPHRHLLCAPPVISRPSPPPPRPFSARAPPTTTTTTTSAQVPGHALGACKEAITKAAADALLAYRTHCAAASSSGQLILPEALKLLPLYTLALTKAPVFRCDCRPDVRAAQMWRLLALPAHRAVPLLYARMVSLHTLLERPAASVACGAVL